MSTAPTDDAPDAADVDDADVALGRAVGAPAGAPGSTVDGAPVEEGPRRRLLIGIAAVAGLLLLWMLFRSVPADSGGEGKGAAAAHGPGAEGVEGMANQSDPSWMLADTGARSATAAGSVVPPVYAPSAPGGAGQAPSPDTAATAAAPVSGARDSARGAPSASQANPRREAFLAALRSKPLQAAAAFSDAGGAAKAGATEPGIAPPPSVAEMDAEAQAEAERRSVPADRSAGSPAIPGAGAGAGAAGFDPTPVRASRSSYVTGGGVAPQQSLPEDMAARRAGGAAAGRLVVPVGTVIEGQLHTSVVSDLPGGVVGMVTRDVFDAAQRVVVIPRFSWLYGTYESDVAAGQARLVVQWTAIRFPTGETYSLPGLRAGDGTGASGLSGHVNNHYGRIFGHALLSSIVAAGFESGSSDALGGRSRRDALADATAQQLGQTTAEVTRRNLDIKPTITVPRLTRFSILLDRDLVFPAPAGR